MEHCLFYSIVPLVPNFVHEFRFCIHNLFQKIKQQQTRDRRQSIHLTMDWKVFDRRPAQILHATPGIIDVSIERVLTGDRAMVRVIYDSGITTGDFVKNQILTKKLRMHQPQILHRGKDSDNENIPQQFDKYIQINVTLTLSVNILQRVEQCFKTSTVPLVPKTQNYVFVKKVNIFCKNV